MTREEIKKLKKILDEVVELPDGSMTFRKYVKHDNNYVKHDNNYVKHDDNSVDGWYAIS